MSKAPGNPLYPGWPDTVHLINYRPTDNESEYARRVGEFYGTAGLLGVTAGSLPDEVLDGWTEETPSPLVEKKRVALDLLESQWRAGSLTWDEYTALWHCKKHSYSCDCEHCLALVSDE